MDIIISQLALHPVSAQSTQDPALSPAIPGLMGLAAADPQATARFADLMAQPSAPVSASAPLHDEVSTVHGSVAPATGGTLGDAILGGIKNASADFQDKWASVQSVLEGGKLTSVSEMLKLQLGVVQMSVQYEVLGKAVSRSTQNIDQLVKMQ